jgi:hypothetical protein
VVLTDYFVDVMMDFVDVMALDVLTVGCYYAFLFQTPV